VIALDEEPCCLPSLSYDDSCITFIATKTDDVSCGEVIRALNLEEDTELQKIEDEIEDATESMGDWKGKKLTADKEFKRRCSMSAILSTLTPL
jgi:hypothetical protein